MIHEVAAGGIVIQSRGGREDVCLILRDRHGAPVWGLPKGHVEAGEAIPAAALREVQEETGLAAAIVAPLTTVRYRFTLSPASAAHSKTVHFFLMEAYGGRIRHRGQASEEVLEARWMSFDEAMTTVTFANERRALRNAKQWLAAHRA